MHPGSRGHWRDARRPSGAVAPLWVRCPRESFKSAGWNWKFRFGACFDRRWKLFSNTHAFSAERRRRVASSTRTIGDAFANLPCLARIYSDALGGDFTAAVICRAAESGTVHHANNEHRTPHAACGWPAGCQCIVHRASCTSRGVSEPQQLHSNLPEALGDRPFKLSVRSETHLRLRIRSKRTAPRVIGAMTRATRRLRYFGRTVNTGSEQDLLRIDGMEGSRSPPVLGWRQLGRTNRDRLNGREFYSSAISDLLRGPLASENSRRGRRRE